MIVPQTEEYVDHSVSYYCLAKGDPCVRGASVQGERHADYFEGGVRLACRKERLRKGAKKGVILYEPILTDVVLSHEPARARIWLT